MTTPRVIVDEREKPSDVPFLLKDKGLKVEFKLLDVADYVTAEVAIERKTARDFVSSLYSGRLFDQVRRLAESYELPVMIVEGDIQSVLSEMENPRVYWGALISVSLSYRMRIFFTWDKEQTADFISTLARQRLSKKRSRIPFIAKKPRIETVSDAQLALIETLPGIGPKFADRLLKQFGTVRKIFSATAGELSTVGKIGEARARKIAQVLDARYRPHEKPPLQTKLEN